MALLDDLFSALSQPQTPWAQEALRRMAAGEDIAGADAAVAARQPKKAPKVVADRQAPPPSADVRNPGRSADPFQAGPARLATPEDIDARDPQGMWPHDVAARPEIPAAGGQMPPAAPVAAPAPSPARSAPERASPRTSAAPAPATFQGADVLNRVIKGITGLDLDTNGDRERVRALTRQAVIDAGGSQANAELAARDPRVFLAMMPTLTANKTQVINSKLVDSRTGRVIADYGDSARQGPEVKTIKLPNGEEVSAMWDAASKKWVTVDLPGSPPAATAPPAAAAPSAPTVAAAPGQPEAPAAAPVAPAQTVTRDASPIAIPAPPPGVNPQKWREAQASKVADEVTKLREKTFGSLEYLQRSLGIRDLMSKPFETPYRDKAGDEYNVYGDVVGRYAAPNAEPAGAGFAGQATAFMRNIPGLAVSVARDWTSARNPVVAQTNTARDVLGAELEKLATSQLKATFGGNPTEGERESIKKSTGRITAQNAATLRETLDRNDAEALRTLKRGIDAGLIDPATLPPEVITHGIRLGVFKGRAG